MGYLPVGLGRTTDLINLKTSLQLILEIQKKLNNLPKQLFKNFIAKEKKSLEKVFSIIENNILDKPNIDVKTGNIIKNGVNKNLDIFRKQINGDKDWICALEEKERKRTDINSLKIKFNKIFGYYIEITKANINAVPANYIRKQTMVNGERFITPELKEYEKNILSCEEKINKLEYEIFLKTIEKVLNYTFDLQTACRQVARLDCLLSLASLARQRNYTRPQFNPKGEIKIKEGRHAVVETLLGDAPYVPNDIYLNQKENNFLLLTGPNMAGKSVLMRQIALMTLLAHIGSFVPAESAQISLVDKIFVRSGAADLITAGLSTFMVEMAESAYILNNATPNSLIIMDEIGRGTSTYDGISLAWAISEYLITKIKAKTIFATHYHEMQKLAKHYPAKVKNYQMEVEAKDGELIFLHKISQGASSHSYGVAVAELGGVPKAVTKRAWALLKTLENKAITQGINIKKTNNPKQETSLKNQNLIQNLQKINLNNLTPLQALNKLHEFQKDAK